MKQYQAWTTGGAANDWFQRNRQKYETMSVTPPIELFTKYVKPSQRVIEIGCCTGHHLNLLQQRTRCFGVGTDPSIEAIAYGRQQYPHLQLFVGTADRLNFIDCPFRDASFDAVWFSFCLYLVDRDYLCKVVLEADRVLKAGGYLFIADFDPVQPCRRTYVHDPGLWSYKMNYPALWLANPAYTLVEKVPYSHTTYTFHADPQERLAAWVLYKQPHDVAWPEVP